MSELPAKIALVKGRVARYKNAKGAGKDLKKITDELGLNNDELNKVRRRDEEAIRGFNKKNREKVINALRGIDKDIKISVNDFEEEVNKYDFAEKMGFTWQETEEICDEAMYQTIYEGRDYYLSHTDAEEIAKEIKGIHQVIFRSTNEGKEKGKIVRSSLRVRYSLKIHSTSIVRCKLHMYYSDDRSGFVPYDGVAVQCGKYLYFYFTSVTRLHRESRDMVTIVCKRCGMDELQGIITSMNRDGNLYSSSVYIRRIRNSERLSDRESRDEVKKMMREHLGPVPQESIREC